MFRDSSSADWTTMYGFMKIHNFVDTENAFKDLKSGSVLLYFFFIVQLLTLLEMNFYMVCYVKIISYSLINRWLFPFINTGCLFNFPLELYAKCIWISL